MIFTLLIFQNCKILDNQKIKISVSISDKIKDTYLVSGKIRIRNSKIPYDLFLSTEKSGILINEKFYDFSEGNILFLMSSKKGNWKQEQNEL